MSVKEKLQNHVAAWKRILLLSRKPDEEEFGLLTRLTLLGVVLVGAIAYVVHLIYVLLLS
ncbi:MAG: protein translocase SEC61 complex subunit gamma [Acidilobus sp.]|uniref:protein translocase SEC61 complex subunit gamma n=1 Tax=Acidilobus sp. 7A TaxID=1577685 RepID=UPI0003C32E6E|nr:protein translocase SEC61 complex subunit gamma [Acidilobus sp. 7A]AMD30760.1 preprotein translocase subunit SecE [Acidilobus sp. 7A]ESQ26853.1 MAG: protein translocase SEC61 complex gamma subunit, archaeal and eukaryotic [uncultured Acidilobus sp. OSP8]